ncbi:MAG: ABC transporter substrate-binding protein [Chlorobium limicola]|nr:ABC transporter substrate-binding protein [Chlorobium limicola]
MTAGSFLFLLLLLISCNQAPQPAAKPGMRTVTDMAGRAMQVPEKITRVYVNKPGSVLMYAIAPDLMVNRLFGHTESEQRFMLESYNALPYIDGSAEEIMRLKPDVIIEVFTINPATIDQAEKLSKKTGIPVFMVSLDMKEYPEAFNSLGNLLGRQEQADLMKQFLDKYLKPLEHIAATIPDSIKKRIYYAEGDRGLHTDPSGSFHSVVIDYVGGKNVADVQIMQGKGMSPVSMEQVYQWDPDVILVWTGMGGNMATTDYILKDPLWQRLRAVRNGDIHQIPFTPFGWFDRPPGINRLIGAIWAAETLYPDLYPFDIAETTKDFFKIFYHRELSDVELQHVLNPQSTELRKQSKSF